MYAGMLLQANEQQIADIHFAHNFVTKSTMELIWKQLRKHEDFKNAFFYGGKDAVKVRMLLYLEGSKCLMLAVNWCYSKPPSKAACLAARYFMDAVEKIQL